MLPSAIRSVHTDVLKALEIEWSGRGAVELKYVHVTVQPTVVYRRRTIDGGVRVCARARTSSRLTAGQCSSRAAQPSASQAYAHAGTHLLMPTPRPRALVHTPPHVQRVLVALGKERS